MTEVTYVKIETLVTVVTIVTTPKIVIYVLVVHCGVYRPDW